MLFLLIPTVSSFKGWLLEVAPELGFCKSIENLILTISLAPSLPFVLNGAHSVEVEVEVVWFGSFGLRTTFLIV